MKVFMEHSLAIARKTVKMRPAMVGVMGGMSTSEAYQFLLQHGTEAEKVVAVKYLQARKGRTE